MTRPVAALGLLLAVATMATGSAAIMATGSAATLEIGGASLGTGSVSLICDHDIEHRFSTAPSDPLTVTALQVRSIDMPGCRDHELRWAVLGAGGQVLDGGTAIVTSASMSFKLVRSIPAADIAGVEVVVRGRPTHPGQGQGQGGGRGRKSGSPVLVVHLS